MVGLYTDNTPNNGESNGKENGTSYGNWDYDGLNNPKP